MEDLVQWLGEQYDEDERTARATTWEGSGNKLDWELAASATIDPGGDDFYVGDRAIANHVVAWDPARVLREIDAKRQIVQMYAGAIEQRAELRARMRQVIDSDHEEFAKLHRQESELIEMANRLRPVVQLLALPYADRPGYREEWRP